METIGIPQITNDELSNAPAEISQAQWKALLTIADVTHRAVMGAIERIQRLEDGQAERQVEDACNEKALKVVIDVVDERIATLERRAVLYAEPEPGSVHRKLCKTVPNDL
jgi:hypothetical protein